MKFNIKVVCLFILVLCAVSCKSREQKLTPGVYVGIGDGHSGKIMVEVIVGKNNKIADVNVVEYADTPGLSEPILEKLSSLIVEKKSIQIDCISGATGTSKGLLEAVNNALWKARRN